MAHRASVVAKPWGDSAGHMVIPMSIGLVPPQYSAPPPPPSLRLHSNNNNNNTNNNNNHHHHHHQYQQHKQQQQQQHHFQQRTIEYPMSPHGFSGNGGAGIVVRAIEGSITPAESHYNIPETHKSMWAINPLYTSNTGISNLSFSIMP